MQGHIDLVAIVLLLLGGAVVYVTYRNPELGVAIGVGVAVITVAYLLMGNQ